jgi:hypothetical protein
LIILRRQVACTTSFIGDKITKIISVNGYVSYVVSSNVSTILLDDLQLVGGIGLVGYFTVVKTELARSGE